jgi:hypothetical protein
VGGSARRQQIIDEVQKFFILTSEQDVPYLGLWNGLAYDTGWVFPYLAYGILENSKRGVWSLIRKGRQPQ